MQNQTKTYIQERNQGKFSWFEKELPNKCDLFSLFCQKFDLDKQFVVKNRFLVDFWLLFAVILAIYRDSGLNR